MTGKHYRLPTEAEWQSAAESYWYDSILDEDMVNYAWYENNSERHTHPVGQKREIEHGFYDMHGNVYEWCQDFNSTNEERGIANVTDPIGPSSGTDKIVKGGCWCSNAKSCKESNRIGINPTRRESYIGFRLAMSID